MKISIPLTAVDRAIESLVKLGEAADHIGNAARNLTASEPKARTGLRSLRWAADAAWMRILGRTRIN